MKIESDDKESLIKYRLEQAKETISDVEFEKDIVIEMFQEMKDFITEIKSHLKIQ